MKIWSTFAIELLGFFWIKIVLLLLILTMGWNNDLNRKTKHLPDKTGQEAASVYDSPFWSLCFTRDQSVSPRVIFSYTRQTPLSVKKCSIRNSSTDYNSKLASLFSKVHKIVTLWLEIYK